MPPDPPSDLRSAPSAKDALHAEPPTVDLAIIGGGIQGACLARDAAGRGLSVALFEKGDLAGATSSASSKLIHGGLRYLEHGEFRLVREALAEREVLLRNAPHLVHPIRFVLPHVPSSRPRWMVRLGLFLYDRLGGARSVPASAFVRLEGSPFGRGLAHHLEHAHVYSDCFTDDARLVVLNALDAANRGAQICTRTEVIAAHRSQGLWSLAVMNKLGGQASTPASSEVIHARALVNAAGPWAGRVRAEVLQQARRDPLRLVQGTHIVVPRLHDGDHALTLPLADGRIVFVIPYGRAHSLIGTTETSLQSPDRAAPSADEIRYLCAAVSGFLTTPVRAEDVVWSFAGVRPLYEIESDTRAKHAAVSREDVLELSPADGGAVSTDAPLVDVFGGKLTTARRVAERTLATLAPWFPQLPPAWTADAALPGGDQQPADVRQALGRALTAAPGASLDALVARHGSRALQLAKSFGELGEELAPGLHEAEIVWLMDQEWALTVDDILWRRTKAGLGASLKQQEAVARLVTRCATPRPPVPAVGRDRR